MENLKIRVMTEQESKEAQELFFELGFKWNSGGNEYFHVSSGEILAYSKGVLFQAGDESGKEITLPQLRDKVVLHRNDAGDANYTSEAGLGWFVSSDVKIYNYQAGAWVFISDEKEDVWDLIPLEKSEDMENLISGEEALSKVHTGTVQYVCLTNPVKNQWVTITDHFWDQYHLGVFLNKDTTWRFRLKPRTIKIGDVDVPAPFEPKIGDVFYLLTSAQESGFIRSSILKHSNLGAWRTEEEIKQVVAALRKLMGVAK